MPLYNFFDTQIEYLKGVGPKRADILKSELQIFTFGDLLNFYPFRYVDRSKFYKIKEINAELPYIQVVGKIRNFKPFGNKRTIRLNAAFYDETGEIELVWFNGFKWILDKYKQGNEYIVFGKPSVFSGKINIAHPEIEELKEENEVITTKLSPFYSSGEKLKSRGLDSKGISKIMRTLVSDSHGNFLENLPDKVINDLKLISREEAMTNIHFPESSDLLLKAQNRIKFEEFFFIQLRLLKSKFLRTSKFNGHKFQVIGEKFNDFFHKKLPFELTSAQKKVIKEIRVDVGSGKQMNRLLQGDVGSGKTLVALMSMLMAIDNGCQASLMAPTEILANQHFNSITNLLDGLGIKVELLTGSTKAQQRKIIFDGIESGTIDILIGTHALIEDNVNFKNLGLVVIDEQHRFGVAQRAKLWEKNSLPPHILVMTATPIPRTLAMTVYGDLDISVIDELPPGRKPIRTFHYSESSRNKVFAFMKEQIKLGRQIYIVYPLINESETLDLNHLMDGYESICREFPIPQYLVSIVHGQMKSADKDFEMMRFKNGETNIMVATTVIEVGVDIPNASVMIIENSERFGLSQLHQLRGRVGRGADQSYCILLTGTKLSNEAKKRIETMVETNDGFCIAEADLKLRGPGDIDGLQQSGIVDLRLADIVRDEQILKYARNLAMDILNDDPELEKNQNERLSRHLKTLKKYSKNWSLIS
jgi:ATP-dependent DNA helicase RecG